MHGYSRDQAVGKHFTILVKEVEEQTRAELIQQEAFWSGWSGELKRVRSDGVELETRKTLTPVKNEAGSANGLIAVTQDITRRKQEEA